MKTFDITIAAYVELIHGAFFDFRIYASAECASTKEQSLEFKRILYYQAGLHYSNRCSRIVVGEWPHIITNTYVHGLVRIHNDCTRNLIIQ